MHLAMLRLNDMPRLVHTDMGTAGARAFGFEHLLLTLEESTKNTAYIVSAVQPSNILVLTILN